MSDEKINYCDKNNVCTCKYFPSEKLCRYHEPSMIYPFPGGCIMRTWFDTCMSPRAQAAAKGNLYALAIVERVLNQAAVI